MAYRNVKKDDVIFVFDYAGEDDELISIIQNLQSLQSQRQYAMLVSITGANNNTIQNMSNENLYLFTGELKVSGIDMTSHVSLIVIMELLLYQFMEYEKSKKL